MQIKVKALSYNVTGERDPDFPEAIIVNDIKVKLDFGENTSVEVAGLHGNYKAASPFPFVFDLESFRKMENAAHKAGIDQFEASVLWEKAEAAVTEVLEQAHVLIE